MPAITLHNLQTKVNIFYIMLHSHAIIDGCVMLYNNMICPLFIMFFNYSHKIYYRDPVLLPEIIKISFHHLGTHNLSNLKFFERAIWGF